MKTTFEIEYTDDLVEFDEQWNKSEVIIAYGIANLLELIRCHY